MDITSIAPARPPLPRGAGSQGGRLTMTKPAGPAAVTGSDLPAATDRAQCPDGPSVPVPGQEGPPDRPVTRARLAAVGSVAAGAAVLAVAGWPARVAVTAGTAGFNVALILIVAGIAIGELAARGTARRRARLRPGTPPAPISPRWLVPASVAVITLAGMAMGFISLFAIMVDDACYASRCDTIVGTGWLVLMATQALTFPTALLGAATARHGGQLARAVLLGAAGPFIALFAFGAAVANLPTG